MLAIPDGLRVSDAGQQCDGRHLEQEIVAQRHRVEQDIEAEILGQRRGVRWKNLLQAQALILAACTRVSLSSRQHLHRIEIAIPVHEEGLHDFMRSLMRSCVSRYFSAMAIA